MRDTVNLYFFLLVFPIKLIASNTSRAWNFLNEKKNGHLRFFHQLVEGISQIIFQQKLKYFIEGFLRKIAKSKMAAIFTTPCIENLDWKDTIAILWRYFNSKLKMVTYFISLSKNYYLFLYHSFKMQTRMNHCLFVWNTKKIEENTKKL